MSKVRSINRRGAGNRRKRRRSKRRRARKLNGDGSTESGGRTIGLPLSVDGFGYQLFLVAQHGVLMVRSDSEVTKGGKLGYTSHQGGKIWGRVGRVNMDGIL